MNSSNETMEELVLYAHGQRASLEPTSNTAVPGPVWKTPKTCVFPVRHGTKGPMAQKAITCLTKKDWDDYSKECENNTRIQRRPHIHITLLVSSFESSELNPTGNFWFSPYADGSLEDFLNSLEQHPHDATSEPKKALLRKWPGCLAAGLEHIHNVAELIHKDIKPTNILISGPLIIIADLGISNPCVGNGETDGPSRGTDFYKPLECLNGGKRGQDQDIWAIGLTFLDMETSRLGLRRKNMHDDLKDQPCLHLEELRDKLSSLKQSDNVALLSIIRDCLQEDRHERPSATKLRERLELSGLIGDCCSHTEQNRRREAFEEASGIIDDSINPEKGTAAAFVVSTLRSLPVPRRARRSDPSLRMLNAFLSTMKDPHFQTLQSIATSLLNCWVTVTTPLLLRSCMPR